MENLSTEAIVVIVTTIVAALAVVVGTMVPTWVEGKAVEKAIEGMARQPEASSELRSAMIIALALLETASIYVLLIVLVLLFANPLLPLIGG